MSGITARRWIGAGVWMGFALLGSPISAASIEAAGGGPAEVQAAIDTARDGDVVLIPAGTFAWAKAVKLGTVQWGPGGATTTGQKHLFGDSPLPRKWPDQALEPLYEWNNTLNGKDADFDSASILIQERKECRNDTPRPGYTPYAYPHPLIDFFDREVSSPPVGRP
jgi:hypothetical protein